MQGYKGILERCQVCHGVVPNGLGPHKMQLNMVNVVDDNSPKNGTALKNPYPNPSKDKLNLPFQLSKEGFVHIEIFDINGNLLITPLNQFLLAAEYSVPVDINSLPSGKYFYMLSTNGKKLKGSFQVVK